ncbi:MAG: glycosyltransferase family 2 protein [Bacteroidota bacterium]|nr:glycosyltransferase family 2 protein [Bacteroidota bacterium]
MKRPEYFPLFPILKYLTPTHYFHLRPKVDHGYFPTAEQLDKAGWKLEPDTRFRSEEAQLRDLGWRALHSGFINPRGVSGQDVWTPVNLPVRDQYLFLRKNFHSIWILYVLLVRLLSFKDPIREISGYLGTRGTRRERFSADTSLPSGFDQAVDLIQAKTRVTVIIPTLNRYSYLKDALEDLEKQTYREFEVVVVDQSEPFDLEFYKDFDLDIRPIHQEEKALWLARNRGIQEAKYDIVAFTEDDVRLPKTWLEDHLKCLDHFDSDISSGVFYPTGSSVPNERNFFKYAEQFATGNVVLFKRVFEENGLYDRTFERQRMGDGEYGLRSYLAGYRSIANPRACCEDVKAPVGGLRQMGSWDAFRPKKFWSPRPIPSVIYFFRKYFGAVVTRWALLKNIPPSIMPYQFKRSKPAMLVGGLISVLLLPIVLYQVFWSWRLANRMLGNNTGK